MQAYLRKIEKSTKNKVGQNNHSHPFQIELPLVYWYIFFNIFSKFSFIMIFASLSFCCRFYLAIMPLFSESSISHIRDCDAEEKTQ